MKTIPLTKGYETIVDDIVYEWASKFNWSSAGTKSHVYALRGTTLNGRPKSQYLHREIMSCPPDLYVDHINRNTLDNRKENLRIVSATYSNLNRTLPKKTGISRYPNVKGLRLKSGAISWVATLQTKQGYIHGGTFATEDAAHKCAQALHELAYGKLN